MKQEEIIEGNRLMAEFEGDTIVERTGTDKWGVPEKRFWYVHHTKNELYLGDERHFKSVEHAWSIRAAQLNYQESWDYLIPVSHKILQWTHKHMSRKDKIGEVLECIEIFKKCTVNNDIPLAWQQVVDSIQFIKWYNKEK